MTSSLYYKVACGGCGRDGELRCQENDAPFTTQWESWSVSPFVAHPAGVIVGDFLCLSIDEALARLDPTCDQCGSHDIHPKEETTA